MSDNNRNINPRPKGLIVLQYSGMAFEMLATILLGWSLGNMLDKYFKFQKPAFAVGFILLFTLLSLYRVIKSLDKLTGK